jgi:hypothetical protein
LTPKTPRRAEAEVVQPPRHFSWTLPSGPRVNALEREERLLAREKGVLLVDGGRLIGPGDDPGPQVRSLGGGVGYCGDVIDIPAGGELHLAPDVHANGR